MFLGHLRSDFKGNHIWATLATVLDFKACTCPLGAPSFSPLSSVNHAASWKLICPHFQAIFQDLVFPMMCYSNEDDQLWHTDPYEYIRLKFGK